MSSSVSYLTSLFPSYSTLDPLLSVLYGGGSGATSANPVQALRSAELNQTQEVKATAAGSTVTSAMANYTKAVTSAKSMTQLLANPAFMNVLLTANGMSDQVGYNALATKALTSNLKDSASLANRLTDRRWKDMATNYDFSAAGLASFQQPANIAAIGKLFATVTWQKGEDAVTPGLSNALAFKSQASTITSVDQILGNMTMRKVVTMALGIPQEIAFQSLDAQEKAISSRVDVTKFKDPKFVETFLQRYLIANAADVASSPSSAPSLTTLAVQARGILV